MQTGTVCASATRLRNVGLWAALGATATPPQGAAMTCVLCSLAGGPSLCGASAKIAWRVRDDLVKF